MHATIVIAEDEADIRTNLKVLLALEGFSVHAAANGQEAFKLVLANLPDLVLSDVMMPMMSGHELVKVMRGNSATAQIPVVLLTARADRTDVREGMNMGADNYLTKPYQRDELLTCIRAQLDKAAAQQISSKRILAQAHRMSHYDRVTELPNRSHFALLLKEALSHSTASGTPLTLWAVGVDNLAQLAHALGAGPMDAFIAALGLRLSHWARTGRGAQSDGHATMSRIWRRQLCTFVALQARRNRTDGASRGNDAHPGLEHHCRGGRNPRAAHAAAKHGLRRSARLSACQTHARPRRSPMARCAQITSTTPIA